MSSLLPEFINVDQVELHTNDVPPVYRKIHVTEEVAGVEVLFVYGVTAAVHHLQSNVELLPCFNARVVRVDDQVMRIA